MRMVGWLRSEEPAPESVSTSAFFEASPEEVWQRMLSYEEVTARPPLILRALLPLPLRTEGDPKFLNLLKTVVRRISPDSLRTYPDC
jgi:hypothetical protein